MFSVSNKNYYKQIGKYNPNAGKQNQTTKIAHENYQMSDSSEKYLKIAIVNMFIMFIRKIKIKQVKEGMIRSCIN